MGLMDKIFGTYSERELKRIYPIRDKVLALDEQYSKMSDQELKAMTPKFKERLANGETLDDILPEAWPPGSYLHRSSSRRCGPDAARCRR